MNKNTVRNGVRLVVTGAAAGVAAYTPAWMQDRLYDAIAKGAAVMASAAAVDVIWTASEAVAASSLEVNGEVVKPANVNIDAAGAEVSITTHSEDAVQTPPTTHSVKQSTSHNAGRGGAHK